VKEVDGGSHENGREHPHQLGYFWLCGSCCRTLTIVAEKGRGVRVMPLPGKGELDVKTILAIIASHPPSFLSRRKEDLPAPLGPTTTTTLPVGTVTVTSSTV
jgi:hypothetical protein